MTRLNYRPPRPQHDFDAEAGDEEQEEDDDDAGEPGERDELLSVDEQEARQDGGVEGAGEEEGGGFDFT